MRLLWLMPTAFGRFRCEEPLRFDPGLNMVVGENEAGKSTLGSFILGMLYGFKKEGITRVYRTPEFERYRPWGGKDYCGTLAYEGDDGRRYRLYRSFDPDVVQIYDEDTGEDLTAGFSQDTRREYDFVARHLGLSQKEFRNTIWIEQLGSIQEPGLGPEIQGKLQSIVYGGTEDVALGRALDLLLETRNRIKSPRSTKAEMDVILNTVETLQEEAEKAAQKGAAIREWLLEASEKRNEMEALKVQLAEEEDRYELARYLFLRGILTETKELDTQIRQAEKIVEETCWARGFPDGLEEDFSRTQEQIQALSEQVKALKDQMGSLGDEKETITAALGQLGYRSLTGWDEARAAALYARFLATKASAARCARSANDARRLLREVEEEGTRTGLGDLDIHGGLLQKADELTETCKVAESQKNLLELEVERARANVLSVNPAGVSSWLYTLALGIVGVAVVLTVMGWPPSLYLFGVALFVFAVGGVRYRGAKKAKEGLQQLAREKEREVLEQEKVVERARQVLEEFLSSLNVTSVEQLRVLAQRVQGYRNKLANAQKGYEVAHGNWFEASQEFSVVEGELVSVLSSSGCLSRGEAITDGVVDAFKHKLGEIRSHRDRLVRLEDQEREVSRSVQTLNDSLLEAGSRQKAILDEAGATCAREFERKAIAFKAYRGAQEALDQALANKKALLSGRDPEEIHLEAKELLEKGGWDLSGSPGKITEQELESKRQKAQETRDALGRVESRLLLIENSITMKSGEGRSLSEIQEDLKRAKAAAKEMALVWGGLDLAYSTLDEVSRHVRRGFVPALSQRVSGIVSQLTGGRYTEVKVSPDLEPGIVSPEQNNLLPAEALSCGTVDQCYFALRIALAESVIKKESFPLFLDDSFAQYDDTRTAQALRIVASLASVHQVILFGHGREAALARRLELPFRLISLDPGARGKLC